jgi:hypothetical protein
VVCDSQLYAGLGFRRLNLQYVSRTILRARSWLIATVVMTISDIWIYVSRLCESSMTKVCESSMTNLRQISAAG